MTEIQPELPTTKPKRRGNYKGRPAMFTKDEQTYICDNPDQLSYSELGRKFNCSMQTIRRVVRGIGGYKREA